MSTKATAVKRQTLPALQLETEYQQRVNEAKAAFAGCATHELVRAFASTRREKQEHEAAIKKLNTELEALSQLGVEALEGSSLQSMRLTTGELVYIQSEAHSSIEDRAAAITWLTRHKMRDMLTVQWQTLNAFNKERLQNGEQPLPGTKVFLKTSLRLRGSSKGDE